MVGFYVKLYGINVNDGARIFKFISELMGLLGCKGFDNIGSTIKLWDIRNWRVDLWIYNWFTYLNNNNEYNNHDIIMLMFVIFDYVHRYWSDDSNSDGNFDNDNNDMIVW